MINNSVLVGRLVKDPELKQTQSGVSYVNITLAVERSYAAEGKDRETDFIDCRAWRNTAEFIAKWFTKGSWIGVEGEIQTNNYEGQDGVKRKAVYIQIRQVSFVGSAQKQNGQQAEQQTGPAAPVDGFARLTDDDIPF